MVIIDEKVKEFDMKKWLYFGMMMVSRFMSMSLAMWPFDDLINAPETQWNTLCFGNIDSIYPAIEPQDHFIWLNHVIVQRGIKCMEICRERHRPKPYKYLPVFSSVPSPYSSSLFSIISFLNISSLVLLASTQRSHIFLGRHHRLQCQSRAGPVDI